MTDKPTEAQVKELWEWCGLTRFCSPEDDMYHRGIWNDKDGMRIDTPPIDLNNLFKYAKQVIIERLGRSAWEGILLVWFKKMMLGEDPDLALFWTIWEVIRSAPEVKE